MAATEQISLRLPKDLLKLLDFLAKRDLRNRSNLIEYILVSWLREHEPGEFGDIEDAMLGGSDTAAPGR